MSNQPNREDAIVDAALDLPPGEREVFLQKACGDDPRLRRLVEALLKAHHQVPTSVPALPVLSEPGGTMVVSIPPSEKPGDQIGRYKLLQQVGEGGCGVVYMAEQEEPVRRRVALKVIKLGMDTRQAIARFEAERQALALMDHPNIAKVLDGGATDTGRPYFVMELVRGVRITDYCDQNNLSTAQRLGLFVQVCKAIQHAHQKGIIHRDIKPSNILVTLHDGVPVPKVIDFGIAKAIEQRLTDKTLFTALDQFMGTPAYMSPEQAEMSGLDIDTRSDIYSLGVLLYELLTGQVPFDAKELLQAGLNEIRRTIREQEPARPSARLSTMPGAGLTAIAKLRNVEPPKLIRLLRGDLDWIAMKCLEKDRKRRYETVHGVAMDIDRHLQNEPVIARPPSTIYRIQKMWGRNKAGFTLGALLAGVLVAATCISTWQAVRATQAEDETQLLKKYYRRMGHPISGDVLREMHELAILDDEAGRRNEALMLREKQLALQRKENGLENSNTIGAMLDLAISYEEGGRRKEALALRERVLALHRKMLGPAHRDTLNDLNALAWTLATSDAAELRNGRDAVRFAEEAVAITGRTNASFLVTLAAAYAETQRFDKAVAAQQEAIGLLQGGQEKKDYSSRLELYQAREPYRMPGNP